MLFQFCSCHRTFYFRHCRARFIKIIGFMIFKFKYQIFVCRNQHSMAFQTPIANTDVYRGSFFPQTIRDWNALPDSLISSAEDAEDCVAKFTSLVRARD